VVTGSVREILEARIRDPRTAARDLASLANALARLEVEEQGAGQPSIYTLRHGTLILEALADAVPSARAHLRQLLSSWGRAGLSQDAGVVVSELVTNSVAASAGRR